METIIRHVCDMSPSDRSALEQVVGHPLAETQQVVVNVLDQSQSVEVPEWWKIYDGLSDEEVDRLDAAIRERANLTRTFE